MTSTTTTTHAPARTVLLIGCGKSKRSHASQARELYIGGLFQDRRRHAEASGRPWFIISAKYGLIRPEAIIEPYDQRLDRPTASHLPALTEWARGVLCALQAALSATAAAPLAVEVHAGIDYFTPLVFASRNPRPLDWITLSQPLAGLGQGQQRAHYKRIAPPTGYVAPELSPAASIQSGTGKPGRGHFLIHHFAHHQQKGPR